MFSEEVKQHVLSTMEYKKKRSPVLLVCGNWGGAVLFVEKPSRWL